MSEDNQVKWIGIRPTNPEEDIPVKQADKTLLKATVDIAASQEIEVVQDTYTDLKAKVKIADDQKVTCYEPPFGTSLVNIYKSVDNDIDILYTIAADKIFHLSSVTWCVRTIASGLINIYIQNSVPATVARLVSVLCPINVNISSNIIFPIAYQMLAGYRFVISSDTANCHVFCTIVGYLRNV